MSKKVEKALLAAIQQMQTQINKMNDPASNPAQQYLTNEALDGANWLKKGDYSQMPKGMFFDFKNPVEQNEQYKKLANVNQGGTFALADQTGRGQAQGIQSKYLSDKFARDASQNYQDNIAGAAGNIRAGLGAAAGAKTGLDSQIFGALQGMSGTLQAMPKKTPWWQSLLSGGLSAAASMI